MTSANQHQRHCASCGRAIDWDANHCPYCGHDFRSSGPGPSQLAGPPKAKSGLWIVAIIVVVVVLVVTTVLYVMVQGFGGINLATPAAGLIPSELINGEGFVFSSLSKETPWGHITILLRDQSGAVASWAPFATNLDNGTTDYYYGGSKALGSLTVWCNITDLAGNGNINSMDFFTLTLGTGQAFSSTTTYTVTIMHNPSAAAICHIDFQG